MNARSHVALWLGFGLVLANGFGSEAIAQLKRVPPSSDEHGALFTQLDANRDGFVIAKEIDKAKLRLFDRMLRTGDRNDDGRLDREEFAASLTPAPEPQSAPVMARGGALTGAPAGALAEGGKGLELFLARMDRNGDGKLAKEEAPPRLKERFERIDANGDGSLDSDELAAMAKRIGKLTGGK